MDASYISQINSPYLINKTIAHSTIGICSETRNTPIKLIKSDYNIVLGDLIPEGLTINVFFDDTNTVFNNNLRLKFTSDASESDRSFPIISSILDPGTGPNPEAGVEPRPTIFTYPKLPSTSIVTFVYKAIPALIKEGDQLTHYYYDSSTQQGQLYCVWQAVNVQPVQIISTSDYSLKKDFDNLTKSAIVEINNLQDMTGGKSGMTITSRIGGVLEVIPIREESLIIQRVTTNIGELWQRLLSELPVENQVAGNIRLCDLVKVVAAPYNIAMPALPDLPSGETEKYLTMKLLKGSTGYGWDFVP